MLDKGGETRQRLGIVIGDVSDHGISSALLMATARALFRQRAALGGNPSEMVTDVNRQLTRDIGDSGQFMTVFLAVIDMGTFHLSWVRAGHEPAYIFNSDDGGFETLRGPGAALGLDESLAYSECEAPELTPGKILILGTDGLWEVRDRDGVPFGKERIARIIRELHSLSAEGICSGIIGELKQFLNSRPLEDDITLVIVKRTDVSHDR
jgi:sigma-B regulation protein RsbU (phosphoserine phosphatase)